jgi:hypothetical protein
MSKYMTPVLVLVLAVLALTLAYKGGIVITGMANAYNASYREFNVTTGNATPTLDNMLCYDETNGDATKVTLNAFSNTTVLCNVTVTDNEGCQDYNGTLGGSSSMVGRFYDSTKDYSTCSAYNSKNCNQNTTCKAVGSCVAMKNQTVECRFNASFNANNTTWTGNINVTDTHNLFANDTDTITMDNLNALNITNSTINLGTYAPGANSSTHPNGTNIQNGGNIRIDVSLNGTTAFTCPTAPNINIGNLTYDLATGTAYGSGTALTTTATAQSTFNLDSNATSTVFPTAPNKYLYWGIGIPIGTIGGQICSATIRVAAIMDQ